MKRPFCLKGSCVEILRLPEEEVGTFAGFPLWLRAGFLERVDLVLKGNNLYNANISDTPLGTMRSLEHSVGGLEAKMSEAICGATEAGKRVNDFESKIGQAFEHESKLQSFGV